MVTYILMALAAAAVALLAGFTGGLPSPPIGRPRVTGQLPRRSTSSNQPAPAAWSTCACQKPPAPTGLSERWRAPWWY